MWTISECLDLEVDKLAVVQLDIPLSTLNMHMLRMELNLPADLSCSGQSVAVTCASIARMSVPYTRDTHSM